MQNLNFMKRFLIIGLVFLGAAPTYAQPFDSDPIEAIGAGTVFRLKKDINIPPVDLEVLLVKANPVCNLVVQTSSNRDRKISVGKSLKVVKTRDEYSTTTITFDNTTELRCYYGGLSEVGSLRNLRKALSEIFEIILATPEEIP